MTFRDCEYSEVVAIICEYFEAAAIIFEYFEVSAIICECLEMAAIICAYFEVAAIIFDWACGARRKRRIRCRLARSASCVGSSCRSGDHAEFAAEFAADNGQIRDRTTGSRTLLLPHPQFECPCEWDRMHQYRSAT